MSVIGGLATMRQVGGRVFRAARGPGHGRGTPWRLDGERVRRPGGKAADQRALDKHHGQSGPASPHFQRIALAPGVECYPQRVTPGKVKGTKSKAQRCQTQPPKTFRPKLDDGRPDIFCGNYWVRSPMRFDLPWHIFAVNLLHADPEDARFIFAPWQHELLAMWSCPRI